MRFILAWVVLLALQSHAQAQQPAEPWSLSPCCSLGGIEGGDLAPAHEPDPQLLYRCVQQEASSNAAKLGNAGYTGVALISYATPDIVNYAAYSFAINVMYAQERGYPMHLYSPATGSDYMQGGDQRWNRVKILSEILDPETGTHRRTLYVVWLDADLIVLDWTLRFESLVAAHPDADIIISAERHAETGVANTGCFIVRNSPWSRAFLSAWWTTYDKSISHDQTFFDRLYRSLPSDERRAHIAILPVNALNSMSPPMVLQGPGDKVLHLMGETAALRRRVFSAGLRHLCGRDLPSLLGGADYNYEAQLGLTQPVLLAMALETWHDKLQASLALLDASPPPSSSPSSLPTADLLTAIGNTREVLLQIKKLQVHRAAAPALLLSSNQSIAILSRLHARVRGALASLDAQRDAARQEGPPTPSSPSSPSSARPDAASVISALNLCGLVGQDLAQEMLAASASAGEPGGDSPRTPNPNLTPTLPDGDSQRPLAFSAVAEIQAQTGRCLERLLGSVAAQSRVLVLEMQAMHLTSCGAFLQQSRPRGDEEEVEAEVIDLFHAAIALLQSARGDGANMHHALPAYEGLAGALCSSLSQPAKLKGLGVYQGMSSQC